MSKIGKIADQKKSKANKAVAQIQRKNTGKKAVSETPQSNMSFLESVSAGVVQPKLSIGAPNDKYEVEADRMADKVMRMPAPGQSLTPAPENIQRKETKKVEKVQRKCTDCEQTEQGEEAPTVQLKEMNSTFSADTPVDTNSTNQTTTTTLRASVQPKYAFQGIQRKQSLDITVPKGMNAARRQQINRKEEDEQIQKKEQKQQGRGPPMHDFSSELNQSKGSGRPMDSNTESFMSSRFGADFSGVKIHTGNQAVGMSNAIQAKAFTHQNHIYFNQGEYQPNTTAGKTLLAHELTHTIQQGAATESVQPKIMRAPNVGNLSPPVSRETRRPAELIHRKCASCEEERVQRKCTSCEEEHVQRVPNAQIAQINRHSTIQRKSWDKEEQYNPYSSARLNAAKSSPAIQRKELRSSSDVLQREPNTSLPTRGPPGSLSADHSGKIRRDFFDDPLGSIGSAISEGASYVGGSLDAGIEWVKDELSELAMNMPGYALFSVVIGQDPITGGEVERNGYNFINAGLDIIPNGADYKRKLEEDGGLAEAAAWLDEQIALLDVSIIDVRADFNNFIESLSLSDITSPRAALSRGINVFEPYVQRIIRFASNVATKLLEIVKEIAVNALLEWVRTQTPWYPLISVILGEDPITGDEVPRTGMNMLRGFIALHPEGDAQLAQMQESGALQRAAEWIDTSILRVTRIISGLTAGVMALWNNFSITDLLTPVETFGRVFTLFREPVTELVSFALEVAGMILQFIKDALIQRLIAFARTIPGYHLVTVIMGKDVFSEEPIERTPVNIIRGFMSLVPGGEEKFQELQQTGAIGEALAWIEGAVAELDLTWGMVRGIFNTAWESFSLADLATPIQTFQRVMDLFGAPLYRLIRFVGRVVIKLIEIALRIMGFPFELIGSIISRAQTAYEEITNDPIGFLKNLLRAVKQAFVQFFNNILTHLINGVGEWLFGQLGDAGITIPTDFSFQSILGLVFQILGVTRERIYEKIREKVGPERWAQIEGTLDTLSGVWSFVSDVVTRGPIAIWEKVQEQLSNLWETVLSAARNWIMTRIITQVTVRLLSMLDPTGIMAVVNSFLVFFNAVQSAIEYMIPMLEMLNSFLGGVVQIAQGNVQPAADFLERTMARGMPILIGFLANQVGLGGIGRRIREVIESIQERVDRGIQWAIDRAWEMGGALLQMGRNAVGAARDAITGWWNARKSFRANDGQTHNLFFDGAGEAAELYVASRRRRFSAFIRATRAEFNRNGSTPEEDAALSRAEGVTTRIDALRRRTSRTDGTSDHTPEYQALLDELSTHVAQLMTRSEGRMPVATDPSYGGLQNGFGTSMTAEVLSRLHRAGSAPGSAVTNPIWAVLIRRRTRAGGGSYYVRGHLLNDNIGGPGTTWNNLTPLTQTANNRGGESHLRKVEAPLKTRIQAGRVFKYTVRASSNHPLNTAALARFEDPTNPDPQKANKAEVVRAEQHIPRSLITSVEELNFDGTKKTARAPGDTEAPYHRENSTVDNSINTAPDSYHVTPIPGGGAVSPKLEIGAPNDPLELEADRMADQVMRMPKTPGAVQRKCTECGEDKPIQRSASGGTTPVSKDFQSKLNQSSGQGTQMDSGTQSFMESSFNADFSNVRIHTGSRANELSSDINARAFTTGSDIYFNQGEYNTSTSSGKHLLAHELTHTIQQGAAGEQVQRKKKDREKVQEIRFNTIKGKGDKYGGSVTILTTKGKYKGYLVRISCVEAGEKYFMQKHKGERPDQLQGESEAQSCFDFQVEPLEKMPSWKSLDKTTYYLYVEGVDVPENKEKLKEKDGKELAKGAKSVRPNISGKSTEDLNNAFDSMGLTGASKGDGTTGAQPTASDMKRMEGTVNETANLHNEGMQLNEEMAKAHKLLKEKFPDKNPEGLEPIDLKKVAMLNESFMLEGLLMGAGTQSNVILKEAQELLLGMSNLRNLVIDEIRDLIIEVAAVVASSAILAFFSLGASIAVGAARVGLLMRRIYRLKDLIDKVSDAYKTYNEIKTALSRVSAMSDAFDDFRYTYQELKGKYDELKDKIEQADSVTEEEEYILKLAEYELVTAIQTEIAPGGRFEAILEYMMIPKDADLQSVILNLPAGVKAMGDLKAAYIPGHPPNMKYAMSLMKKGFVAGKLLFPFVGYIAKTVNVRLAALQKDTSLIDDFANIFRGLSGRGRKRKKKDVGKPATRKKKAKDTLDTVEPKKPKKPEAVKQKEEAAKKKPEEKKDKKPEEPKKKETRKEKEKREREDLWKELVGILKGYFNKQRLRKAVSAVKLKSDPMHSTVMSKRYRRVRKSVKVTNFEPVVGKIKYVVKRKDKKGSFKRTRPNLYSHIKPLPAFDKYFRPKELRRVMTKSGEMTVPQAKATIEIWKKKKNGGKYILTERSTNKYDPHKEYSFNLEGGLRVIDKNWKTRRYYFGFSNRIRRESDDWFNIMRKGFTIRAWDETKKTKEFKEYEVKRKEAKKAPITYAEFRTTNKLLEEIAMFENARWTNGVTTRKKLKFPFFNSKKVHLGHNDKKGYGASDTWNTERHVNTRAENVEWNKDSDHYWGPEHAKDSSATGAKAAKYNDPTLSSNHMWWNTKKTDWYGYKDKSYKFSLNPDE